MKLNEFEIYLKLIRTAIDQMPIVQITYKVNGEEKKIRTIFYANQLTFDNNLVLEDVKDFEIVEVKKLT